MRTSIFILSVASLLFASCSDDDGVQPDPRPTPVEGATIQPKVGGPNQPNQVFVDLSANEQVSIQRDTWDLGFSTGSDFRVIINGAIEMAVKELNTVNIDEVQEEDPLVAVGFDTYADLGYVDNPTGVLTGTAPDEGTAIAEISATESENKVYLVNLGYEVGTTTPNPGSVSTRGEARGWKKIRITRSGSDYKVDYADLDATTHQTVTISKNADYNFMHLNLQTGQKIDVQPRKSQWDICFTTFTNYYPYGDREITYYFSDFVTSNIHGGTKVYMEASSAESLESDYAAFTKAQVDESKFADSSTDQRIIGDTWRVGGGPSSGPSIRDDRFYVVKDADGNAYKLLFRAMTNEAGERGYPVFEYELLK